jgi:hypothetical protein
MGHVRQSNESTVIRGQLKGRKQMGRYRLDTRHKEGGQAGCRNHVENSMMMVVVLRRASIRHCVSSNDRGNTLSLVQREFNAPGAEAAEGP